MDSQKNATTSGSIHRKLLVRDSSGERDRQSQPTQYPVLPQAAGAFLNPSGIDIRRAFSSEKIDLTTRFDTRSIDSMSTTGNMGNEDSTNNAAKTSRYQEIFQDIEMGRRNNPQGVNVAAAATNDGYLSNADTIRRNRVGDQSSGSMGNFALRSPFSNAFQQSSPFDDKQQRDRRGSTISSEASLMNARPSQVNTTRLDGIMASSSWRRRKQLGEDRTSFSPNSPQDPSRPVGTDHLGNITAMHTWRARPVPNPQVDISGSSACYPIESPMPQSDDDRVVTETSARVNNIAEIVRQNQEKILHDKGETALKVFIPSWSAMQASGLVPDLDNYRTAMARDKVGSNSNYRGDINQLEMMSANIPDDQNCALWVMGLPANVTYQAFLMGIRQCGKICTCFLNNSGEKHPLAAAKVVFFTRAQAERLLDLAVRGKFFVMGQRIKNVRWNKNKCAKYPYPGRSRVIKITGPENLMDFGYFENFFQTRFTYQLDHRCVVQCAQPGMVSHQWYFASVRSQSAFAKKAIDRELNGIFSAEYVSDPCQTIW